MANYPQLDDCSGVWKLKDVNNAVSGGYWRVLTSTTGRALNAGGFVPGYSDVIEQIQIESSGNSTDFGNLSIAGGEMGAIGTPTRMVFLGRGIEASPNTSNIIDYVTIATAGNAADFGDMSGATQRTTGVGGNATRGVFTEGTTDLNGLQYITPSSTGNAITFGDMTVAGSFRSGVTSPTRICYGEGFQPATSNVIDFVEIATTGNAVDFGDLTVARRGGSGLSSSTRGVFAGGIQPTALGGLEFITIASQGNAIDYGDLANTNNKGCDSTSNSVRGIVAGGAPAQNIIQQFNIATGGNTTDFGDLLATVSDSALNSGSHGGLNDGYQGTRIRPIPQGGGAGQRALLGGGSSPGRSSLIQEIQINTLGNATAFGDLTTVGYGRSAVGSSTRAIFGGGNEDGNPGDDFIDYVTFVHRGNAADFGNLTVAGFNMGGGMCSDTRGIFSSRGTPSIQNVMDYVTMASVGNATDFGDLSVSRNQFAGAQSNTRGIGAGGLTPSVSDVIDYVTIANTGNASDFGNLSVGRGRAQGVSSTTRAVMAGGQDANNDVNTIDYITIANTGNATDFGDLSNARRTDGTGASNQIRGVFMGGYIDSPGVYVNTMDYVTIATTSNTADFGDLVVVTGDGGATASNGHGGLS